MSGEGQYEFVDTNVLVYAHDASAKEKHEQAKQLLARLWASGTGGLSIQVLQEFYVTITRKVRQPFDSRTATAWVQDLGRWRVHSPTSTDVVEAIQLHQAAKLSFWDAMLIVSAKRINSHSLWSEDLNDGQSFEGVVVRNPFRDSQSRPGGTA